VTALVEVRVEGRAAPISWSMKSVERRGRSSFALRFTLDASAFPDWVGTIQEC
jgi:hypothetical protein